MSNIETGSTVRNGSRHGGRNRTFFYLKTLFNDPWVATVHPSSRYVRRRVLKQLALDGTRTVVEYGAADGVISHEILKALGTACSLVAIERNEEFHRELSQITDPRLTAVFGNVMDVDDILRAAGIDRVDRVVSGIPFSFLNANERDLLLEKTATLLEPSGRFVAYQCTTHLFSLLKRHFARVETRFEVRNVPPHFIFTCYK